MVWETVAAMILAVAPSIKKETIYYWVVGTCDGVVFMPYCSEGPDRESVTTDHKQALAWCDAWTKSFPKYSYKIVMIRESELEVK